LNYLSTNPRQTILIDCDGVLLDWVTKFNTWMLARGYQQRANAQDYYRVHERFEDLDYAASKKFTRIFNESAAIGFLDPIPQAEYWLRRLNWKMGFRFHVITSQSVDADAQRLRRDNLERVFGDVFDRVLCLETGSNKDEALAEYVGTGCWWIEDKPENALAGLAQGLRPILLTHDHNCDFEHAHVTRANNWQEIYQIIYDSA